MSILALLDPTCLLSISHIRYFFCSFFLFHKGIQFLVFPIRRCIPQGFLFTLHCGIFYLPATARLALCGVEVTPLPSLDGPGKNSKSPLVAAEMVERLAGSESTFPTSEYEQ